MNEVFNHDGTDKAGRVGLDAPRVRRSDAITLMVHHLMLAAMYFEATPDDITPSLDEIMDEANALEARDPKIIAAIVWLKSIHESYEKMKDDD
jgi:hypothetical protein